MQAPKGAWRYQVDLARLRDPKIRQELEALRDGRFRKAKKIKKVFSNPLDCGWRFAPPLSHHSRSTTLASDKAVPLF